MAVRFCCHHARCCRQVPLPEAHHFKNYILHTILPRPTTVVEPAQLTAAKLTQDRESHIRTIHAHTHSCNSAHYALEGSTENSQSQDARDPSSPCKQVCPTMAACDWRLGAQATSFVLSLLTGLGGRQQVQTSIPCQNPQRDLGTAGSHCFSPKVSDSFPLL